MERLRYLDFDLRIDRVAPGRYEAHVLRSPCGEAASSFAVPFTDDRLELLILKLGHRRSLTRGSGSGEGAAGREIGEKLFDSIFTGTVRDCLRASLDDVQQQEATGLRLRLRLQDAPELADLPWEFLYDSSFGRFLAQSNQTPVVRYIELPERVRPLRVALPLRVLALAPAPGGVAVLSSAQEMNLLRTALEPLEKSGRVEVHQVQPPTLSELRRELRKRDHHIFHFIGHGRFDAGSGQGFLLLQDDAGASVNVSADHLGALLHDQPSLRLALLNACEGARNSRTDPFASVATSIIRSGVPAVVAMQFEITDRAAVAFAGEFYSALADGFPVDAAVAEARKAIYAGASSADFEWATPVLYSRTDDGAIFITELAPARPPVEEIRQPDVPPPRLVTPPAQPPLAPITPTRPWKRIITAAAAVVAAAVIVTTAVQMLKRGKPSGGSSEFNRGSVTETATATAVPYRPDGAPDPRRGLDIVDNTGPREGWVNGAAPRAAPVATAPPPRTHTGKEPPRPTVGAPPTAEPPETAGTGASTAGPPPSERRAVDPGNGRSPVVDASQPKMQPLLTGAAIAVPSLQRGVNLPGEDYRSVALREPEDCRLACARDPNCRAYTWIKSEGQEGSCWLKGRVPTSVADGNMVSGVITASLVPGVNLPGGDYRSFAVRGGPEECRVACSDDPKCMAYTWIRAEGQPASCWLKSSIPSDVAAGNCTSGMKPDMARVNKFLRRTPGS